VLVPLYLRRVGEERISHSAYVCSCRLPCSVNVTGNQSRIQSGSCVIIEQYRPHATLECASPVLYDDHVCIVHYFVEIFGSGCKVDDEMDWTRVPGPSDLLTPVVRPRIDGSKTKRCPGVPGWNNSLGPDVLVAIISISFAI
jgi:hypothetical protein